MTHICWARTVPGLTPTTRHVLSTLAGAADDAALAYPGIETLEEWTGLDRATIYRAIKILEFEALIEVIRTKGKGNGYMLLMAENDPSHTATRRTQRPVAHSDPSHSETEPVAHSDKRGRTVRPERFLKAFKEKHISPFPGVAVSGGAKAKSDAAYKRQSATWVEPTPAAPDAGRQMWEEAKRVLEPEIPIGFFSHLRLAAYVGMQGDTLQIRVPNGLSQDTIEGRLTAKVERELERQAGRPIRLQVLYDVGATVDA